MAREIDPQLPFIQVHRNAGPKAAALAPLLGLTYQHVRGSMDVLWESLADRRLLAGKTAIVLDEAATKRALRFAFGKDVDPEALTSAGFLEPMDGGYRVRGMSRYITTEAARASQQRRTSGTPPVDRGYTAGPPPVPPDPPAGTPEVDRRSTEVRGERREVREESKEEALVPCGTPAPLEPLRKLWNDTADPALPRWRETGKARAAQARQRLAERPDLEAWRDVIQRINASDFCLGKTDRGDWRASPDWLLKPDTAARVLEGKYGGRKREALTPAQQDARVGQGTAPPATLADLPEPEAELPCEVCGGLGSRFYGIDGHELCVSHGREADAQDLAPPELRRPPGEALDVWIARRREEVARG